MNKKELSERDICSKFITPAVKDAGWDEFAQIREEVFFTKGRIIVRGKLVTRGKPKFADYILYYKPNIPIAVIEAKDNNHAVGDGMQQALEYAATLAIPFAFSSNGDGFLFHDSTGTGTELESNLALDGFPSPAELWARYRIWKGLTPAAEHIVLQDYFDGGSSKAPRYYQCNAINAAVEAIAKGQLAKAPGKGEDDIPVTSGYIIVDRVGKRFTSENVGHAAYYELGLFDSHRLVYPRVPSFFIFDSKRMANGPLAAATSGSAGPTRLYKWSADNTAELEKGWIKTANTIRGLARKIGVPPEVLEKTVRTFNKYCEKGKDPEFGRRDRELIPLDDPPYYALELWPGGPNTQGGPQRNARGQILNVDGDPIPGLYGCGELGSIYGMLYPGGGANLTECFAFGRIVGENVARERNRS